MPFKRYVEIGRVAMVNYGEDYGKLVVISDVIDQNSLLMTDAHLQLKRMTLTDYKLEIPQDCQEERLEQGCLVAKFEGSSWGRKLAKRNALAVTNDFDRYKAASAKMTKARAVRTAYNAMKKAAAK
eukprot:gene15177-21250_t